VVKGTHMLTSENGGCNPKEPGAVSIFAAGLCLAEAGYVGESW